MKLALLDVRRNVEATPEFVWELLTDTLRWPEWGPSVTAVQCGTRYIAGGSRGRVKTALGLWLPFTVTEFIQRHFWAWRVAGIPATGHRVEALGDSRTLVTFEVPAPAAPYLIVCRAALKRIAAIAAREAR